jgi:hypothetical protein
MRHGPDGISRWYLSDRPPESLVEAKDLAKLDPISVEIVDSDVPPTKWGHGTYDYSSGKPVLVAHNFDASD